MNEMSETVYWKQSEVCGVPQVQYASEGAQFGLGVFETLYVENGQVEFFERHLFRLAEGAAQLSIQLPDREEILAACRAVISEFSNVNGRLKIAVLATSWEGDSFHSEMVVSLSPYERQTSALKVRLQNFEGSTAASVKSMSYAFYRHAFLVAQANGDDEVCFLNEKGQLTEGATSNLFVKTESGWVTPSLECKILPGIMRQVILEAFTEAEELCLEGMVTLAEVQGGVLTNSLRGAQSLKSLGNREFLPLTLPENVMRQIERLKKKELFSFL